MRMSKKEREFHRKTAARAFNDTWDFLDMKVRNLEDEAQMLRLAHTSRYHWGLVGAPLNQAVGDWQISRVYATLGVPDLAIRFAESALSTCRKNGLVETMPSAYEGIARAYAVGKNGKRAKKALAKSRSLLDGLELDKEDKAIYRGQIEDTQKMIDRL